MRAPRAQNRIGLLSSRLLIAIVQHGDGVLMIRFFGSHEDYDKVDAESV